MALRDQPYLPLFVKDYLTDEKLILCSPAAHGIYTRLICILHKEYAYGKIKLDSEYKKNTDVLVDFSEQFSVTMPWKSSDILPGLRELLKRDVIQLRGCVISQKRMVEDNELSEKRSKAGKNGGKKTSENIKKLATQFDTAKDIANSAIVNEIVIEDDNKEEKSREKKYIRDEALEKSIMAFFGFTEMNNQDKQSLIFQFCNSLNYSDQLQNFRVQFAAYAEYKSLTGFKHSFQKFTGDQSERFLNGAWNAENWTLKLAEENAKPSQGAKAKFPDYYDKFYNDGLKTHEEQKAYWQHLRDLEWTTYRPETGNNKGKVVWLAPGAQPEDVITPSAQIFGLADKFKQRAS